MTKGKWKFLYRLFIGTIQTILVLAFIVLEELVWKRFAMPIKIWIKDLEILNKLKEEILQLNEYIILTLFLIILIAAEGLGLLSTVFFLKGNLIIAGLIYGIKIGIAGFTFWLFDVTKEILFKFNWFKFSYEKLMFWIETFKNSNMYKKTKENIAKLKEYFKELKKYIIELKKEKGTISEIIKQLRRDTIAKYKIYKRKFKDL